MRGCTWVKQTHLITTIHTWVLISSQEYQQCSQIRSQVLRFAEENKFLGGQDFCFYYMFKTFLSGHYKIWGKIVPVATALSVLQVKVLGFLTKKTMEFITFASFLPEEKQSTVVCQGVKLKSFQSTWQSLHTRFFMMNDTDKKNYCTTWTTVHYRRGDVIEQSQHFLYESLLKNFRNCDSFVTFNAEFHRCAMQNSTLT